MIKFFVVFVIFFVILLLFKFCAKNTNTNSYFSISIKQNSLRVDNYYDITLKITHVHALYFNLFLIISHCKNNLKKNNFFYFIVRTEIFLSASKKGII